MLERSAPRRSAPGMEHIAARDGTLVAHREVAEPALVPGATIVGDEPE